MRTNSKKSIRSARRGFVTVLGYVLKGFFIVFDYVPRQILSVY